MGIDPNDPGINDNRNLKAKVVKRIRMVTKHFPQYGVPRNIYILRDHWTVENGLLTPTMKLRRRQIQERFAEEIETLYAAARR